VRKIHRIGLAAVAAVLAVGMAACSSGQAPSATAPSAAPPPSAAAANGVTTAADTFGPACSQLPQGDTPGGLNAMGPQPVATAASTNPLLTKLVAAVKATNLVDTLNTAPAITVYAPADPAFNALGDATVNALLKDPAKLSPILQYHVVGKRYDKDGLLQAGTTTQLAGGTVTVKAAGEGVTLTDGKNQTANVLCGNIPTKNATVFVIDKVLMPAS
jgi:uncharacterized surface protein with fasciclin (FAS1) repeats